MSKKIELFHISDVLSVATGISMSWTQQMCKPDGTIRAEYLCSTDGFLELAEYISGQNFDIPGDSTRFNQKLLQALYGDILASLKQQQEWLKQIYFPHSELVGEDEIADIRRNRWIQDLASENGEWHKIEPDPIHLIPVSKTIFETKSGLDDELNLN